MPQDLIVVTDYGEKVWLFVTKRGLDRAHRAADKVARKHRDVRVRVGIGGYGPVNIEGLDQIAVDIRVSNRDGGFEADILPIDSTEYQFEKCTERLIAALKTVDTPA